MAQYMPMPETNDEVPGVIQLLRQLFGEGARVVEAELALARSEAASTMRGYLVGFAVAAIALAMTIVALSILAQSAALAMSTIFTNPAIAYLVVGLVMTLMAVGLALASKYFLTRRHRRVGVVFKQIFGNNVAK